MRHLTPDILVGLMALCIPPVEGSATNPTTEHKVTMVKDLVTGTKESNKLVVRCTRCPKDVTAFDLIRLSELINRFTGAS